MIILGALESYSTGSRLTIFIDCSSSLPSAIYVKVQVELRISGFTALVLSAGGLATQLV
jgi:hypothetical protein